jgi:hypothetical protein
MRAVIQRVQRASVAINGGQEIVGSIGRGLCVLVGINSDDKFETDAEYIVKKLLSVRLFEDPESGRSWAKNVCDLDLEILCGKIIINCCCSKPPIVIKSVSSRCSPTPDAAQSRISTPPWPLINRTSFTKDF